MLIATITAIILLAGGSAWFGQEIATLKANLKTVLVGSENRDEALDVVKEMKSAAKDQADVARTLSKELDELQVDRDAPIETLAVPLETFRLETMEFHRQLADDHMRLRALLTREEWEAVYVLRDAEP